MLCEAAVTVLGPPATDEDQLSAKLADRISKMLLILAVVDYHDLAELKQSQHWCFTRNVAHDRGRARNSGTGVEVEYLSK